MNTEIIGVLVIVGLTFLASIPLGKYMAKVYLGQRSFLDFLAPLEKILYRFCGIHPNREMDWKNQLRAFLTINLLWFLLGMLVLMTQGSLWLNPDHNPSMSPDLAFNTAVSFISNTNLQHYSGESGASYLAQLVLTFFQFVSAACGIAACVLVFQLLAGAKAGNFYRYFMLTITRILLPLAIVLSVALSMAGVPMTFKGKQTVITLQGDTTQVSRGPAAAMIAIKQLGTNGGGFFGANSAHPLENPSYLTNILECVSILLIPIALVFALGFFPGARGLSKMTFWVMTCGFLILAVPAVYFEMHGNPAEAHAGMSQREGNMEGKEVRFGAGASALWGVMTTVTSNGSVNSMHDSFMPLAGMSAMMGMMVNCFFGGVGVGFLNFYIYLIVAVFISGLMVGRTPELLGKKIEAREMKIAALIALLHPFLILAAAAIAVHVLLVQHNTTWLGNPGYHGFSEMLYEYSSASANNGSEFGGLNANNPFWNISDGMVMLLSRYLPIVGPVAIAGLLGAKKQIPESAGTLRADSFTFGLMVFAVIVILAALSFFPALSLGPVAEHFTLYR